MKPAKLGRKPLEKGGSCKRTKSTGEPSTREENKERNTSQLPRLLCWTRVRSVAGASTWREFEQGVFNHFRDKPDGLERVTGSGTWPVGAGWDPLGGKGASLGRLGGLGVERSTVWVEGALGVENVWWPSSPTSMASSLSEEASDSSSSEGGEVSG